MSRRMRMPSAFWAVQSWFPSGDQEKGRGLRSPNRRDLMREIARYRLLVVTFMAFGLLYRILCVPVGLLVLSATGLLISQHYWLAMLTLAIALLYYELIYW